MKHSLRVEGVDLKDRVVLACSHCGYFVNIERYTLLGLLSGEIKLGIPNSYSDNCTRVA